MANYIIEGKNYKVVDALERIPSKDSFTHNDNKLGNGAGAWEWHIGSKKDITKYNFFGGEGFNVKCFLLKEDLIWLMHQLHYEYLHPSQQYREKNSFENIWRERVDKITALEEYLFFRFKEHDNRAITDARLYAKRPGSVTDGDPIYGLIRELALPNITFTSILKLRASEGEDLFYFKIFPEFSKYDVETYDDLQIIKNIKESTSILETEKEQLIKSRIGQGLFRKLLIDECKVCPITGIDDSRLLIASHIKPWRESNNFERLDKRNGLLFTPTYDRLFDNGYITFTQEKNILISPWLSESIWSKLSLRNEQSFPLLFTTGRESYLEYHRQNIFKG